MKRRSFHFEIIQPRLIFRKQRILNQPTFFPFLKVSATESEKTHTHKHLGNEATWPQRTPYQVTNGPFALLLDTQTPCHSIHLSMLVNGPKVKSYLIPYKALIHFRSSIF